jgi:hypothetical protein
MDREHTAMAADLENGGGITTIEMSPCPADRRLREKRLFTWLGELPYVVAVVVGAVFSAIGFVVLCILVAHAQGQPDQMTTTETIGAALFFGGLLLVSLGLVDEGWFEPEDLQRFEPD